MCTQEDANVMTELPVAADRFLPRPEVLRIVGFSAATLWREVKAGRFPAPVLISPNRTAFLESEVRAWMAAKVKTRAFIARSAT